MIQEFLALALLVSGLSLACWVAAKAKTLRSFKALLGLSLGVGMMWLGMGLLLWHASQALGMINKT
jgi:hypothetical protein